MLLLLLLLLPFAPCKSNRTSLLNTLLILYRQVQYTQFIFICYCCNSEYKRLMFDEMPQQKTLQDTMDSIFTIHKMKCQKMNKQKKQLWIFICNNISPGYFSSNVNILLLKSVILLSVATNQPIFELYQNIPNCGHFSIRKMSHFGPNHLLH